MKTVSVTIEEVKAMILDRADKIRSTVDRSGFCKPDCEGCLRAKAKGLLDEELTEKRIDYTHDRLTPVYFDGIELYSATDIALLELGTISTKDAAL